MHKQQLYHNREEERVLPDGFSWKLFLLGPIYTLFLGDLLTSAILALLYLPMLGIVMDSAWTGSFGFWLLNLPFAFLYSKRIQSLHRANGYKKGIARHMENAPTSKPETMWITIPLYGSTTPQNTHGITVGKGKVPKGYHTLFGFLPAKKHAKSKDRLQKNATITIKIDSRTIWQYTAQEQTDLLSKKFTVRVQEGGILTIRVKNGYSELDNIRVVLA